MVTWHALLDLDVVVQLLSHVLCDPMDCSIPGFPVFHYLPEFAIQYLTLRHPLLLLPSVFPSIKVFSKESALLIKWPKYRSFRFSISPSNEYSWLISFKIDWFDLLVVQGTLKSLLQNHYPKASILQSLAFFMVQLSHPYMSTGQIIALILYRPLSAKWCLCFLKRCLGLS